MKLDELLPKVNRLKDVKEQIEQGEAIVKETKKAAEAETEHIRDAVKALKEEEISLKEEILPVLLDAYSHGNVGRFQLGMQIRTTEDVEITDEWDALCHLFGLDFEGKELVTVKFNTGTILKWIKAKEADDIDMSPVYEFLTRVKKNGLAYIGD